MSSGLKGSGHTITYENVIVGVTMKVLKTQQNNPFNRKRG